MNRNETLLKTGIQVKFSNVKSINFEEIVFMLDGIASVFNTYVKQNKFCNEFEIKPYLQIINIKKGSIIIELMVTIFGSIYGTIQVANACMDLYLKYQEILDIRRKKPLTLEQLENREKIIKPLLSDSGSSLSINFFNRTKPNIFIDSETAKQIHIKSNNIKDKLNERRSEKDFNLAKETSEELYFNKNGINNREIWARVEKVSSSINSPWALNFEGNILKDVLILDEKFWQDIESGKIKINIGDEINVRAEIGLANINNIFLRQVHVKKILRHSVE